tara:strand:- start:956 stop:1150 length:195 start_codon:yes stop_codon:yes gene_type:complete
LVAHCSHSRSFERKEDLKAFSKYKDQEVDEMSVKEEKKKSKEEESRNGGGVIGGGGGGGGGDHK